MGSPCCRAVCVCMCVCVCVNPPSNVLMPELIFRKPLHVQLNCVLHKSLSSVFLHVYHLIVAGKRLGKNVTAATNTQAIKELLNASVSYQRKVGDQFFPELVLTKRCRAWDYIIFILTYLYFFIICFSALILNILLAIITIYYVFLKSAPTCNLLNLAENCVSHKLNKLENVK
jgi:hypothetical protein